MQGKDIKRGSRCVSEIFESDIVVHFSANIIFESQSCLVISYMGNYLLNFEVAT